MKQDKALAILKAGKNVFLTGSAGAGKTYVLNQYIQYLKDRKIPVAVTASTGIAATHMEGQTIHSWAGIGIKDSLSLSSLRNMATKKYLQKHLEAAEVLIIDEISMLHRKQFEMVDQVLQYFKENDLAFGGIQVIFSGDFFQLPPVTKTQDRDAERFCFMSPSWVNAELKVCYLTEQFRQSDNDLYRILNEMRSGAVSHSSISNLRALSTKQSTKTITQLYTHNIDVERLNSQALNQLDTKPFSYDAVPKGNVKLQETLAKSVLAPMILVIKKGAKVMFVKNNYEVGYMNGTLGEVIGFEPENDYPIVRTATGKEIIAHPEEWSIRDDAGKSLASVTQVPLRLAWAITVHKSQGMTLDEAEVDLSKTFERGQGYVALSRLKDMDGLYLQGFNDTALKVNELAQRADTRFRELAYELDQETEIKDLEKEYRAHIVNCGGLTNIDEIKRNKKKTIDKKKKTSTVQITRELLESDMSIKEVAVERGLTEGTIYTHLLKLKDLIPDYNIDKYRPKEAIITKVNDALEEIKKKGKKEDFLEDGRIRSTPIYYALNKELSFNEIKIAMLFID